MIRIDLGKDDSKQGAPEGGGGLFSKFSMGGESSEEPSSLSVGGLVKALGNMGTWLGLAVAISAALLPHLFFAQYRDLVIKGAQKKLGSIRADTITLSQEIAKLMPYQKELESYEAQKKLVQQRLDVIRALLSSRTGPVSVLDAVGQALPLRVWITALDYDGKKDKSVMTIKGQAISNEDISDFVDKLSESTHLKEVSLDNVTSTRTNGNIEWKSFQLVAIPKGSTFSLNKEPARALAAQPVAAPSAPAAPVVQPTPIVPQLKPPSEEGLK